jgi:hypothetical protein
VRQRATPRRDPDQPARPGRPELHALHDLQRLAGNAAVGVYLQRQDPSGGTAVAAAPTSTPLTAAQVADALSYYRRQPWLYTARVITDLRTQLGLDPAGGIAEDLAQAVAVFQRDQGANDPSLVVDGKAGPRTTPRLFPTGLAVAGEGDKFATGAQTGAFDEWDNLGTAQARADALVKAVNERLVAAQVPTVASVVYEGDSPTEQGTFDFTTWSMMVNRKLLDQSGLTRDDAADLANTVYHEARHAEQWFWMARLRAGQGYSAAGIAAEMFIPADIAKEARKLPIRPGTTEAVVASGWYESVYGSGAEHRDRVLTEIEAADWAVTTAECRCQRAPSPANDALLVAARERFNRLFDEYRELPEENDAHAIGPTAEPGITSGTPNPVPTPADDPCDKLRRAGRPVPAAVPAP